MREGWEIRQLGEIATIYDHLRKPITKSDRKAGQYPYYGASGVQDYVEGYIFDGRYLLVGEDGAKWGAGDKSAYIVEGKCWVNNHVHILQLNGVKDTLVAYLFAFRDLGPYITGAVVPKMTQQALRSIPIPVPPIKEQVRIVAELDCLSEVIAKKKQQLEELDKLAQSIFYEMFGDPMSNKNDPCAIPLASICAINPKKSEIKGIDMNTYCSFVGMAQIGVNGEIDTSDNRSIQEVWNGFTYFKEEDVLFAKITPCMENGKGAIARGLRNGIGFGSTEFHVIRPNETLTPEFIFYLLANKDVRRTAEGQMTGSGGQRRVPVSFFDIKTTIPPIDLQNEFAKKVEAIEKQKELVKRSIAETETLFNSRMDYWFN